MARKVLLKNWMKQACVRFMNEIELPLVFTLDSMEKWGISVKGEELKSYGEKLKVRIQELEKTIWQEAGEEFNINSPKQLGVILFEKLGLPGGKKTKTGYSTAADILDKLAPDHAIVKRYPGVPPADQAEIHLCRWSRKCDRRRWKDPLYFQSDDHSNRSYQQYRSESSEHTGPHGAGQADP